MQRELRALIWRHATLFRDLLLSRFNLQDCDDVDSDDESFHTKARQVLRKIEAGGFGIGSHLRDINNHNCPFCKRSIKTDFFNMLDHAESIRKSHAKVGPSENVHAFRAKHLAFGIHLRRLYN